MKRDSIAIRRTRRLTPPLLLALASVTLAHADFNPVPLTPGSFTRDIVVEKTAPSPIFNRFVTATVDTGTNLIGNTFMEQGYVTQLPFIGLPPHGTTFAANNDAHHVFQMPPDYTTNNAAFIGTAYIPGLPTSLATLQPHVASAALTVNTPAAVASLSILYGASGAGPVNVTVNHQDGTAESFSFTSVDWFSTSTAWAWACEGRISVDGNGPMQNLTTTSAARLFYNDVTLTNTASPIASIGLGLGSLTNSYRVCAFALSGSADGVNFAPMPVSGFNQDVVVEAGVTTSGYVMGPTATIDGGAPASGNTYYEQGFATNNAGVQGLPGTGTTGLPHPGAFITNGNYVFQMPASYFTNNCVFLTTNFPPGSSGFYTNTGFRIPNYSNGTFNISSPTPYGAVSVLSSGGTTTVGYQVNYDDGSSQSNYFVSGDWFSGPAAQTVFVNKGRFSPSGFGFNSVGVTSAGRLFRNDIALNNTAASATNIAFTCFGQNKALLIALSAQSPSGGSFLPVAITGYDANFVVAASQPYYIGPFGYTTATLDQGTNNAGSTLFEQGWVTNGAVQSCGMPPAGSIISSLANPTNHYQLPPSYAAPNAAMIDVNHKLVNLTPITPATFSACSFLYLGDNMGSTAYMTNYYILQHADGINESNQFFAYDSINNTSSTLGSAFTPGARLQTFYGNYIGDFSSTTTNSRVPRFYEAIIGVNDVNSPVTNIMVGYVGAASATPPWATYIMAVSAGAGSVPAFFSLNPASVNVFEFSTNAVAVQVSGTLPIGVQWQVLSNGVYVNLTDGGNVSGSITTNLTFSPWYLTNANTYRCVASNAVGLAYSTPATIGVLSGYTNIAQVADESDIVMYNGSSPSAETVIHAIDRLVGNDPGKYLNFGIGPNYQAAPYVGPCGFVITPVLGSTILKGLRFYTANDSAGSRDPADYMLEGSNDGGNTWTTISSNSIAFPAGRNNLASGPLNPLTQYVVEALFYGNSASYTSYRLGIPDVANNAGSTCMQIGEVEMLGFPTPQPVAITVEPQANVTVFAGANPVFGVTATGVPQPTYQWYNGLTAIPGATNSTYTFSNATLASSGLTFSCALANSSGSTNSSGSVLTVIPAPTNTYPVAVLYDHPLAYWRLDETAVGNPVTPATPAFDYIGGHNGNYESAITSVAGYNPALDADPAVSFDPSAAPGGSLIDNAMGLSFSAPTNNNVAFSVEAWVQGLASTPQIGGAGVVALGYGGGGEEFALDCSPNFRFYARDAITAAGHAANATVSPADGLWHHVVGVCDEAHGSIRLYVDGMLNATNTMPVLGGIRTMTTPLSIGARSGSLTSGYNLGFAGSIDDVALYNYALTSTQVLAHFYASEPAPRFTIQPTDTSVSEGATATFYSLAYAPGAIGYQWFESDGASYTNALPGQTNQNLLLPNVSAANQNGLYYLVTATDTYGGTTSTNAQLTVYQGPPQILAPIVPVMVPALPGRTVILSASVGGTLPFVYQWQSSPDGSTWTSLADGGRIWGSQTDVLAIVNPQASDGPYYQLTVANAFTVGYTVNTPFYQLELAVGGPSGNINFETNGWYWTMQNTGGDPTTIINNVLLLTDGSGNSAHSAFFNVPLPIDNFLATFVYQDVGPTGSEADGTTFVLQNDPRGPAALGATGGSLGVSGITPSAELEFDIWSGNGVGIAYHVNGANGGYASTSPVNIASGDPILVAVRYANHTLQLTLTDTNVSPAATYTATYTTDLVGQLGGNTAYVGFTGADGGHNSTQTITGFNFVTAPYPVLAYHLTAKNTLVLSWPSETALVLKSTTNLASGAWQPVSASPTYVNGQLQLVVPTSPGNLFYRLAQP